MKTLIPRVSVGLLLAAFALVSVAAPAAAKEADKTARTSPLICWTLPSLMNRYLENHVVYDEANGAITKRVLELYAERFDTSKSLLLQSEYDALNRRVATLIDDVRRGRCETFDWIKKSQRGWHKEMENFARKMLSDEALQIDRTIGLQMDPDKRTRPTTKAERDELRRKLLHFQLANYVRAGTELPEAKKRLIHRYELITKRIEEQTDADYYANFLNAFANALDPHSTYFSADDLEDFRISMDLSLEGIGAVLSSRDGYTTVQEIMAGGAADRHGGLKAKDKIIAVSQGKSGEPVDVIDMALRDVVRLIRGKKGTEVKLTVLRQGERTESHDFLIVRDKIDLKEQAAKLRWEKVETNGQASNVAVIDLPSFYGGGRGKGRDAVRDVRKLLREVEKKQADALVLDLSRNGGGLLQGAVDIAGLFLKEGPMVGIDGPSTPQQVLEDDDDDVLYSGPMVVLTSKASASASEIVAGALKDYRRAVVVGDSQTFGKGSVQNIINLPMGFGALKVTTAMFFRPLGKSTQSRGVEADIVVPSVLGHDEVGEASQTYALPTRSISAFAGDDVQGRGDQKWRPIADADIAALAARSKARVAKDEPMAEVLEALEKRKKNDGVVTIAELMDEPSDEDEDEEAEQDDDKDELSPQAREAVRIAADLAAGIGRTAAVMPQ